jgi:hypothetical protein
MRVCISCACLLGLQGPRVFLWLSAALCVSACVSAYLFVSVLTCMRVCVCVFVFMGGWVRMSVRAHGFFCFLEHLLRSLRFFDNLAATNHLGVLRERAELSDKCSGW